MSKRQRMDPMSAANPVQPDPHSLNPGPGVGDDAFINDHDAVDSAGDDDDEDEKPKSDKKAGRRKIKIEFIQDKSRRHITFSKRKAGTQVLLLVVSETGLVYTFTTAKLQPLVTQPEGKNLIQACLNAPHGTLPSSMPVGTPLGRSANVPSGPSNNIPGGLSIGQSSGGVKEDEDAAQDEDESVRGGRATTGDKRRRASSNATPPQTGSRAPPSPHNTPSTIPPPLSIPPGSATSSQPTSAHPQGPPQPQINLGSPTSPQQSHNTVPGASSAPYSPSSYQHAHAHSHHPSQGTESGMYGTTPSHMMQGGYSYPGSQTTQAGGQLTGLATAAAQQHGHWTTPSPQQSVPGQGGHYTRR
ncbi:transcription factor of the MADS box [Marasmius crinis-equi]|uniref:Transcription factor of the MADS box n=1 Tax=Marasmius crinis-equi TaxID=585013 RepID=A0ABR3FYQ2_9AGAR